MRTLATLLLLTILFTLIGNAQRDAYYFNRVEGLPSSTDNLFITKDKRGFVWISSSNGLHRFDGKAIKTYLNGSNILSAVFEGHENDLWVNNSQYFRTYELEGDTFRSEAKNISSSGLRILYVDTLYHQMIFKGNDSIYVSDLDQLKSVKRVDSLKLRYNTPFFMFEDRYCICSETNTSMMELKCFTRKEHQPLEPKKLDTHLKPETYFLSDENTLWIGTGQSLIRYDVAQEKTTYFQDLSINAKQVRKIYRITSFGKPHLLLIAGETGIFVFDTIEQKLVSEIYQITESTLSAFDESLENIYLDEDNTLWLSIENKGVYFTNIDAKQFDLIFPSVLNRAVNTISEDENEKVWCATAKEVFYGSEDKEEVQRIALAGTIHYGNILHTASRTWLSSFKGIFEIDRSELSFKRLHELKVFNSLITSDGSLISSSTEGTFRLDLTENNPPLSAFAEELPKPNIFFAATQQGRLIGYAENKLHLLQSIRGNWKLDTVIPLPQGIVPYQIIADQKENAFWLASTKGLWLLEDLALRKIGTFPDVALKSIIQADDGSLWMGSDKGLWQYSPQSQSYRQFSQAYGLRAMEFRRGAVTKTKAGKLIFGNVRGANIFDPSTIKLLPRPPKPILTKIVVNNVDTIRLEESGGIRNPSEMKHIVLARNRNALNFHVAVTDYINPGWNRIQYRLLGLDEDFFDDGKDNFFRYTNLGPGDYTLEIRAVNSDGTYSAETTQLSITIKPAFYETPGFYFLLSLTVVGLVYWFYRSRLAKIERKAEAERKQEEVKRLKAEHEKAEANQQLEKIESEMAMLRLQMNPHFLFNALSAVKQYIDQNPESAKDFLGRFAAIMRKVLNIAVNPYTYLMEEVELLTDYLEVEKLRFPNKLHYQFEYDKDDLQDVEIPTMLLQPFVENAILHGIAPKKDAGLISIRFVRAGEYLRCEVEDNGRGIQKKHRKGGHQSKALEITSQRLDLLEKKFGYQTDLKIINLGEQHPTKSGVLIQITIPVLE